MYNASIPIWIAAPKRLTHLQRIEGAYHLMIHKASRDIARRMDRLAIREAAILRRINLCQYAKEESHV